MKPVKNWHQAAKEGGQESEEYESSSNKRNVELPWRQGREA